MSIQHALKIFELNNLSFALTPVSIRELLYLKTAPCTMYVLKDHKFELFKREFSAINKVTVKELLENGHTILFVPRNEKHRLVEIQQENLRKVTRALSIGDPLENGKQVLNLLTINLAHVYSFPTNNDFLKLQYQSAKNLSSFLLNNTDLHEELYLDLIKQKHYYIYSQPLLSSLFLLGILKFSNLFTLKDIESLFLASYFKDIGMSSIPSEKYQQVKLNAKDKEIFLKHPKISVTLLKGRIPILPHHLSIIENHHAFSLLTQDIELETQAKPNSSDKLVIGIETMLISVSDVIAAMITSRPYREAVGIFEALERIKKLIAPNYPQEFRLIVSYFRNSLFKNKKYKISGQS